jgi:hypothetical protein
MRCSNRLYYGSLRWLRFGGAVSQVFRQTLLGPLAIAVLLSRITKIDGDWMVDAAPIPFFDAEGDPAEAQARRWGEAWRSQDSDNRRYVTEDLPD